MDHNLTLDEQIHIMSLYSTKCKVTISTADDSLQIDENIKGQCIT